MGKCEFMGDVLWHRTAAPAVWVERGTTVQWPGWGMAVVAMAVVAMADARAVSLSVQLTGRQRTGGIRTVF